MTAPEGSPTRPRAFGEELRRVREEAGLDLDTISQETKVSRRVLEALEAGEFHHLPERVFSRNFVRQFVQLVGADEEAFLAAFDAAWGRFELTSGSHPAVRIDPPPPRSPIRWRFWIPIALGAVILLAVGAVILAGGFRATEELPDPMRAPTLRSSPTADDAGAVPSPTLPPTPEGDEAVETAIFTLRVAADGECWVHVRDREGRTEQRLLVGGSRTTLELSGPVRLTVGNAGAVEVEANGRVYRDLGEPGQVVHLELGRGGLTTLGPGADVVR